MAGQSNQPTFAEKSGFWLKAKKQQPQQQQRQQQPVEQVHHEQQLDQKSSQKQLAVRDQMKVMTFAEQAGHWYKNRCSQQQPQQKHDQQYSQEQQQIQLQQQKVQQPLQQEQQPLQQNKQYEHKSHQTPGLTGRSPIQTPGQTGQGPVQTPGQTGQGPIQTPGQTGQVPIQTPGLTGQDPVHAPGLTGQGPILANKVSLSQHHDAHGQGRLSAQMSPTEGYSEYHFQQHHQQHTGVDDRQPTDSPHNLPQSSLVPDVMSMLSSVPHSHKRTRLTKTSSATDAYNAAKAPVRQDNAAKAPVRQDNAAKAPVRQDFNDGSHPETNVKLGTQDLSAVEDGTRKREQALCLEKKKEQPVSFLHNPRRGQIIELDVSQMEAFCDWDIIIGKGSYGIVCKAKIHNEEEIGKYVIKKIQVDGYDDFRMKSYEREILHGRILHPHIIPIIALAEDISKHPGAVYLMYPYMENGSVCQKIEEENKGNLLCKEDRTNSKIWLRCLYQVSQVLDYLHKPGKNNSRGPVFHRDLTSRNILFDEDFNVKICDFGIAVEAKYHAKDVTATPLQWSMGYHSQSMDPKRYRAHDDVYSFCVLVLEILTGEVVKNEEPFKKYKIVDVLLQAIRTRAKQLKVPEWPDNGLRDQLAKKAWVVITSDTIGGKVEMTAADFFKDARVETRKRYQQPKNPNRCVLCYINPTAKNLRLMGEKCKGHSPPCAMYCIHCLSDHHNQLVCPLHGPSRPPFGDHVYGVFVAGNHVKHFQGKNKMSLADIAGIFTRDAIKVASILKFPLVLGIRNEHLEVVTPKEPGKEGTMVDSIEEAFKKINSSIRKVLTENGKNPDKDRLENSLFMFYFTGHGSKEYGMYLGSEKETISASTEWLKKMLCETLRVDQVLVILDCCDAVEQNFVRKKEKSEIGILQLSSCDKDEESVCKEEDLKESVFTSFLCEALQGDNFVETGGHLTKLCEHCKKDKKETPYARSPCEEFHLNCSDRQSVTLSSVKDNIRGHYKLLGIELKMKEHCDDADEIHLGYYKPEMSSISICLKEAQNGDKYPISSHPESMSSLRQCIVRYIVDKKIQCQITDMLEFYRKLSQTSAVEKTCSLIAIHPVAERESKELISLEDLWKITPCGRALEAKIRDNVTGLKLGRNVKLYSLKRAMVGSLEQDYEDNGLKICKEYIHVQVNLIKDVIIKIIQLQNSDAAGFFSQEFKELLKNLQEILVKVFDNMEGTVIKFQLYDDFSVVEVTQE